MKKIIPLILILANFVSFNAYAEYPREKLVAKKTAILKYLKDVESSPKKFLSGQRYKPNEWNEFLKFGKFPAIMDAEYCKNIGMSKYKNLDAAVMWRESNKALIDHSKKGGLITITTHFPNPYNENFSGLRQKLTDNAEAVLKNGTPERTRWLAMLNEVVKGVKELNSNGIVPIMRPFHEASGAWFWWGSTLTPDKQKALTYDFFNALNNAKCVVIWQLALSFTEIVPQAYDVQRYDIVGVDMYGRERAEDMSVMKKYYDFALENEKLFMLSEFGPYNANGKTKEPKDFNCLRLADQLEAMYPKCVGALWWASIWAIQSSQNSKEYMNDSRTICLGDLPSFEK